MEELQKQATIIAAEECAELTQVLMKIMRFGICDDNLDHLIQEMGDVTCMLELVREQFDIPENDITNAVIFKREKLRQWSDLISN